MKGYLLPLAIFCLVTLVLAKIEQPLHDKHVPGHRRDEAQDNVVVSGANADHTNSLNFLRVALTDKALPPLDQYTVKQIRDFTLPQAYDAFEKVAAKGKNKTGAELDEVYFNIVASFIKARSDATRNLDTYFSSIYNAHRQLPKMADANMAKAVLDKFKTFSTNSIPSKLTSAERKQIVDVIAKF